MSDLDDGDLDAVFVVYRGYLQLRKHRDYLYDWDDLAVSVAEALRADDRPRLYRHVVIDEGQDFSPTMLRSLAKDETRIRISSVEFAERTDLIAFKKMD